MTGEDYKFGNEIGLESNSVVLRFQEDKNFRPRDDKNALRFSNKEEEKGLVTLDVFLSDGNSKKRVKPMNTEDLLNSDIIKRKMKKKLEN